MKQEFQHLPLSEIHVKNNYRKTFNDKSLKELAQSIKKNGVLEPVIVCKNGDGYNLIAGERRLRASYLVNLVTIPAVIRGEVSDGDFMRLQIIENVQREGVQYMEEAYGLRDLRDKCDLDAAEMARLVGKSELYVSTMLRMTEMTPEAREIAHKGEISKSVAFHIARLKVPENQTKAARDLRRPNKSKLVSEGSARHYIQNAFDAIKPRKKTYVRTLGGNDFQLNWKKYLVNFTCEQFERFKEVVHGRTDTQTLVEAVDVVMRESK